MHRLSVELEYSGTGLRPCGGLIKEMNLISLLMSCGHLIYHIFLGVASTLLPFQRHFFLFLFYFFQYKSNTKYNYLKKFNSRQTESLFLPINNINSLHQSFFSNTHTVTQKQIISNY